MFVFSKMKRSTWTTILIGLAIALASPQLQAQIDHHLAAGEQLIESN